VRSHAYISALADRSKICPWNHTLRRTPVPRTSVTSKTLQGSEIYAAQAYTQVSTSVRGRHRRRVGASTARLPAFFGHSITFTIPAPSACLSAGNPSLFDPIASLFFFPQSLHPISLCYFLQQTSSTKRITNKTDNGSHHQGRSHRLALLLHQEQQRRRPDRLERRRHRHWTHHQRRVRTCSQPSHGNTSLTGTPQLQALQQTRR